MSVDADATTASSTTTSTTINQELTRLHISPLNASLLHIILGPSVSALVADASYHELPSFPDKNYGYVTLPTTDAHSLQKKLNGTTLRGVRMRVEEARPERKRKHAAADTLENDKSSSTKSKKRDQKRTKLESGVLPAVELPEGRHVKRGWIDHGKGIEKDVKPKNDKKSKGEVVFRTQVPAPETSKHSNADGGNGKGAGGMNTKKRVELKEFDKTDTFPRFLRDEGSKDIKYTTKFIEGKGWVDEAGEVVESVKTKERPVLTKMPVEHDTPKNIKDIESESEISSALSSSSDYSTSDMESDEDKSFPTTQSPILASTEPAHASLPAQSAKTAGDVNTPPPNDAVHPLEALFKKPVAPNSANSSSSRFRPAPIKTSFSFGLEDQDEHDSTLTSEFDSQQVPQTPFTRQDLRERGVRSAAPTPDTAAIGRTFSWGRFNHGGNDDDNENDSGEEDENALAESQDAVLDGATRSPTMAGEKEQNEAERRFYERRGEYNRAFKARKRDARKQVRQAENRRVGVGK